MLVSARALKQWVMMDDQHESNCKEPRNAALQPIYVICVTLHSISITGPRGVVCRSADCNCVVDLPNSTDHLYWRALQSTFGEAIFWPRREF